MITVDQAREYLESVGVELPGFILEALVESVNTIDECLERHYSEGTALLIQLYLIGLLGLAQGDRYISSQSAPSGASRSFRYMPFAERWRGMMALLLGLDKHGCADDLIPPDPTTTAHGYIGVARGGCHE